MAEVNGKLKTVIEILHDGHEGFAHIGENLKDTSKRSFFLEESQTRSKFEHELTTAAGFAEHLGGSAVGTVHRAWGELKAKLGGGDHTLLETAEQGEDAAKKAYKEALEDHEIPSNIREILSRQQTHIAAAHDKVKALRDATK